MAKQQSIEYGWMSGSVSPINRHLFSIFILFARSFVSLFVCCVSFLGSVVVIVVVAVVVTNVLINF